MQFDTADPPALCQDDVVNGSPKPPLNDIDEHFAGIEKLLKTLRTHVTDVAEKVRVALKHRESLVRAGSPPRRRPRKE